MRWVKRIAWVGFMVVLVVVPARLAHSPAPAQAAPSGEWQAKGAGGGVGHAMGWVVGLSTVGVVGGYWVLRRRRA